MASMDTGQDPSKSVTTEMVINLADQLLDAFQQDAEGAEDGQEAIGPLTDDDDIERGHHDIKHVPYDDGSDGDCELPDMTAERLGKEDDDSDDIGGAGTLPCEEWASPIGCHREDDTIRGEKNDDCNDLFMSVKALHFDGSEDGDIFRAADQNFPSHDIYPESDFLDSRPELHGSESADKLASSSMNSAQGGDQTHNVRIIEGHDDLDTGAVFASLALRNSFLQTQKIQLPILSAEDFHNQSTNLYDSLEREDQDFFPDNDSDREVNSNEEATSSHERELSSNQNSKGLMPSGHSSRDTEHPEGDEECGYSAQLQQPDLVLPESKSNESINDAVAFGTAVSQRFHMHVNISQRDLPVDQPSSYGSKELGVRNGPHSSALSLPVGAKLQAMDGASNIIVSIPNQTEGGKEKPPNSLSEERAIEIQERREPGPKLHPSSQQAKGGAAVQGRGIRNGKVAFSRVGHSEQRSAAAGTMGHPRTRDGVGSSAKQSASGTRRPAVQGSAASRSTHNPLSYRSGAGGGGGGGDGDGGGGDGESDEQAETQNSLGSVSQSRASSQCSNLSAGSYSRVGGVGKESHTNSHRPSGPGAGASHPPPPRQQQSHPPQVQHQLVPAIHSGDQSHHQPTAKRNSAATSKVPDGRSALLQQQKKLQAEHEHLQLQIQHHQRGQHGGEIHSPGSDPIVYHHPEAVTTQMGQIRHRQEELDYGATISSDVQRMEEVRSRLQNMLRLSADMPSTDHHVYDFADSTNDMLMDRPMYGHHDVDSSSIHSGFRNHEELSEMLENFPSFPYKIFSDMSTASGRSDASMQNENIFLREALEKERYRRKHCEQQIQSLNTKLLEVQQQLAVSVSTDKRKDIMIDQLDKQLAKVVEGWKRREQEKDEYMHMMMKEKTQIENTLRQQQAMIDDFEMELTHTVDELKKEKETSGMVVEKMRSELSEAVHQKQHAEELVCAERARASLIENEWEQLKEARDLAEKRVQQAQERLHEEEDNWYQREKELLNKIDQVKEANLKVMQMERIKMEEQKRKIEEMEDKLHAAETEVKRMEMELDCALREKEGMKVEMALTEAKFENAQRSLEADLQAQMEKEIAEQLDDMRNKMSAEQEEAAEKHRRTVTDLHQRHQREMEKQMANQRQEFQRKEDDYKQQLLDVEKRLSEYRQENTALKQAKQKLESQRMEILTKLQFMMQSQWNEAVSLLVSTPQRKTLNSSFNSMGSSSFTSLMPSSHTAVSQASAHHFPSSLPASATSSPKGTSHHNHRPSTLESSAPHNGSTAAALPTSAAALPALPAQNVSTINNNISQSVMTLQDISDILSQGRQQPPLSNFTNNIHGILHHQGLILQNKGLHKHYHLNNSRPHLPSSSASDSSSPQSESCAVLIRPPQQHSHSLPSQEGSSTYGNRHLEGSSFKVVRSSGENDLLQNRQRRNQERGAEKETEGFRRGRDDHHLNVFADGRLELSDLDSDGLQNRVVYQGVNRLSDRETSSQFESLHGRAAYLHPERSQSLSPPVKQCRDEGQENENVLLQESDRLNDSYREISRQLEEHQSRQRELQHYIKMLLDRPPQMLTDDPEKDSLLDADLLETSLEAADLDLCDGLNTRMHHPPYVQQMQLAANNSSRLPATSVQMREEANHQENVSATQSKHVVQQAKHFQLQQLAEVSQQLKQSREVIGPDSSNYLCPFPPDSPAMAQLLAFLTSLPPVQSGFSDSEEKRSSSIRNSPRSNHTKRIKDEKRKKRAPDSQHSAVGPETNLSSSVLSDRTEKLASSSRSASTRKMEKKAMGVTSATPVVTMSKNATVRPVSRDHSNPAWK